MEYVILVDEHDKPTGTMEKMQAHVEGRLHRALSVFIFNSKKELLLQQRALTKYHSAGLWTNTCCSHPRDGEATADAANRRLVEEMGITCLLHESFSFVYKASLGELTEYEYDHVFTGVSDQMPKPNPMEVGAWKYINIDVLVADIDNNPELYTEWFKICMKDHFKELFQ